MSEQGVSHGNCVSVVIARHASPSGLVAVGVGDGEDQVIEVDHHESLDQITIDCISHPSAAGLDIGMVGCLEQSTIKAHH